MICKSSSAAWQRYQRDIYIIAAVYFVLIFSASYLTKNRHVHGVFLYIWSVLPALPVIGMIARMGRYLQEETDEYERLLTMRAILVGTAAMLGCLVVNDFVRTIAGAQALPPFTSFVVFCAAMSITQLVQKLQNRPAPDEK